MTLTQVVYIHLFATKVERMLADVMALTVEQSEYGFEFPASSLLVMTQRFQSGRFHWHARGTTAAAIIRALHHDDVLDFLPDVPLTNIQLYVATLPPDQAPIRQQATNLLHEMTQATIHHVPGTGHMLHWDRPDVIIEAVRHHWSFDKQDLINNARIE
ncbi:alpha/beta fold hydrolase [Exiguobacterium sp. Leaf196]|uniref:alpha/beta fold hydrolase n=1 Tax=Exiguobacterium sp. Leaf196 TaxID=1736298 RepID=UPI0006FBD6F2|nr:alpha/beta hydrolase [Exiguobacterium sp. Leaf196]KQS45230.1 hypothetical protein ASG02_04105 [Exiguobacterium sp. Leaf196]